MIEFHTVRRDDLVEPRRVTTFPRGAKPVLVAELASIAAAFEPGPATRGVPLGWRVAGAQSVAEVTRIANGGRVDLGNAAAEELVFILRGQASLEVGEASTSVWAGWLVVVPPGRRSLLAQKPHSPPTW